MAHFLDGLFVEHPPPSIAADENSKGTRLNYVSLSTQNTTNALLFGTRWSTGIDTLMPYQNLTSIVFIDGSLTDLQTILTGLDPSITAIVLDPAQDGIQQMADALAGMSGLDAIHIISHGAIGQINLGTTQLTQDILAQYQTQLTTIGHALTDTGDLLLYGCNVAQGDAGQAFISALANATGADVAASTGLTGTTFLGGEIGRSLWDGYIERKLGMPIAIFLGHNAKKLTKEFNYGAGSPSTNGG